MSYSEEIQWPDDVQLKQYCYRCGHIWQSGKGSPPRMCPRCRSSRWNVPLMKDTICRECDNGRQRSGTDGLRHKRGRNEANADPLAALHCNQCDHEWLKRSEGPPKRCPVCRSPKWNEEKMPQYACHKCGHVWKARTDPKKCPKCQSVKWNVSVHKLQCRRCGYKWTTRHGRTSDDVKTCPSCKSRKWNEGPRLTMCKCCGIPYVNRSNGPRSYCPSCDSKNRSFKNTCGFCGTEWNSKDDDWNVCPFCGKPRPDGNEEKTFEIYADGRFSLRYVYTDECDFIYLWEGRRPVATMYFRDLLLEMKITVEQFRLRFSDPKYKKEWSGIAERMYEHRDDHIQYVPYMMKRLNLCKFDATVLSIHFTGMGPEAIAIRFGLSSKEVRESFDRIMAAYLDSGILVNDSIFTDDPISLYR